MALVTFTVTVQLPLAGMVAPLRLTELPPATAVTVPPVHVVVPLGEAVLTSPEGYVSVKAAPVMAEALLLVSKMVMVDDALRAMGPVKLLVVPGGVRDEIFKVALAPGAATLPALAVVI